MTGIVVGLIATGGAKYIYFAMSDTSLGIGNPSIWAFIPYVFLPTVAIFGFLGVIVTSMVAFVKYKSSSGGR